jgi:hypothetical protein
MSCNSALERFNYASVFTYLYTLHPQKLALTSPTSGGRSVGIVRWRIQATEFDCLIVVPLSSVKTHNNNNNNNNSIQFIYVQNFSPEANCKVAQARK